MLVLFFCHHTPVCTLFIFSLATLMRLHSLPSLLFHIIVDVSYCPYPVAKSPRIVWVLCRITLFPLTVRLVSLSEILYWRRLSMLCVILPLDNLSDSPLQWMLLSVLVIEPCVKKLISEMAFILTGYDFCSGVGHLMTYIVRDFYRFIIHWFACFLCMGVGTTVVY